MNKSTKPMTEAQKADWDYTVKRLADLTGLSKRTVETTYRLIVRRVYSGWATEIGGANIICEDIEWEA